MPSPTSAAWAAVAAISTVSTGAARLRGIERFGAALAANARLRSSLRRSTNTALAADAGRERHLLKRQFGI
ncbi:MAG: hypothetical protein HUU21_17390 [Polyangiaceae bacterium]|nr:hypothetical protein [Polyangiaceae bacterium]